MPRAKRSDKSRNKVRRIFTLSPEMANLIDRVPDGLRSRLVNKILDENREQILRATTES